MSLPVSYCRERGCAAVSLHGLEHQAPVQLKTEKALLRRMQQHSARPAPAPARGGGGGGGVG